MRPTRALIHRRNLSANLELIRSALPRGTALCAAVKADAYGHSAKLVVPWLRDEGVEALGIATVEEGLQLRRLGFDGSVYLLGTLQQEELAEAVDADFDLFVWTKEAVEAAASAARGRSRSLRVHLKVDTGMGRVGCRPEEAEALAEAIVRSLPLEFTGLCTHLAS
jgi:alanine racemase